MSRSRTTSRLVLAVLAATFVVAPAAHASPFSETFAEYKKTGKVNPCLHGVAELKKAKKQVPPDIEQYAPDFPAALDAALQARVRGACATKKKSTAGGNASTGTGAAGGGSTTAPPAAGAPTTSTPATSGAQGSTPAPAGSAPTSIAGGGTATTPAPTSDAGSETQIAPQPLPAPPLDRTGASTAPAPIVALGIVGLTLLLCALLWATLRSGLWQPRWLPRARHAWGEAGYRAGSTWEEFTDWMKLGR